MTVPQHLQGSHPNPLWGLMFVLSSEVCISAISWWSLLQHWSRRASFVTIRQTWQNLDAIALYWVREEMINNCMWLNSWGIHWQKVVGAAVKHVGGHEDVHDTYVVGHCVITISASLLTRTGSVKSKSRSRWFGITALVQNAKLLLQGDFIVTHCSWFWSWKKCSRWSKCHLDYLNEVLLHQ